MEYDPLKDRVAAWIRLFPTARLLFYRLLDLLLLRQRYVKRCLRCYAPDLRNLRYHDAGAGFCQYSWHMLRAYPNCEVLASDLKADYLESFALLAQERFPGRFSWQAADLQNFAPEGKFDLISAIDILEHIPDDEAVLRNFRDSLNPAGILIISTPSDLDEAAQFTAEHVRPGYDKLALEDKLRRSGFGIVESLYSYGIWGSLAWRLLIKHPLSFWHKSKLSLLFLPLYLPCVYPLAEILMQIDLRVHNTRGTGLIVVARRDSKT